MSYKTSNPSDLADSVTMRTVRGGYCEERGSEEMKERDEERPGSLLQQPSVTSAQPWHQEQPFSGKECASLEATGARKTRPAPAGRSAPAAAAGNPAD